MSKFLKAIDLYGKLPKDLAEPTSSGAIMSIITFFFLGLLLLTEIFSFIDLDVKSDIIVNEDTQRDRVQVNLDIHFLKLPCQFLDIQVFDAMGQILKEEHMSFNLFRLDKNQKIIGGFTRGSFDLNEARKAFTDFEGCELSGYLKVNKVPGKIQFGPHRTHHQTQQIERGLVLDLSHKFVHLSFGDDLQHQKVKKQFSQGQLNTLDGVIRQKQDSFKTVPVQHEHYVSIVPTIYTLLNKQEFQIFQYTANHNEVRAQYYPQMIIRYDISPVTVKFWQTRDGVLQFIVSICAILGGIFTVSGMIESGIHTIMLKMIKAQ